MTLINNLLQRAASSDRGVYVYSPWDSLERSDRPHLEKCWLAWTKAETALRNGDLGTASSWLGAAERLLSEQPDSLATAEVVATRAELLEAAGEFRDAFDDAILAFQKWFAFAENMANWNVLESVRALLTALEPDEKLNLDDARVQLEWMLDRLSPRLMQSAKAVIRLCAPLGITEPAETVFEKMSGWLNKNLPTKGPLGAFAPLTHADFVSSMANLYDQMEMPQRSLDMFLKAIHMLEKVPDHPEVFEKRVQYQFNAANEMAKLGRHAEAVEEFDRLANVFEEAGSGEPAIRARHASVLSRWRMGNSTEAKEQLEVVILEYESNLTQTSNPRERLPIKQNLRRAYSLWLTLAVAHCESDLAKRQIFGQLAAMREGSWTFQLSWSRAFADGKSQKIISDVEILDGRLSQRRNSVLLIVEQGVDQLVLATLSSEGGTFGERVQVAGSSSELTDALVELLLLHRRVTNQIIDREIGVTSRNQDRFVALCKTVWSHLPESIQHVLSGAETVFISPSNAGEVDEIPFELLHDGTDYLGLSKTIVRVLSIGQLLETMSPNRINRTRTGKGLIVEAGEIAELGKLPGAEAEVARTKKAFNDLGVESEVIKSPTRSAFLDAISSDVDLFHFVGHGFADEAGEALFLAEEERVSAVDLASCGPAPAPICILSSCLLGRTRDLSTGEQRGIASALLRQGAPAVIAATFSLPDHVGSQFASAFYFHARKASIGEAMRRARKSLGSKDIHPAAWASFVLFGEHEIALSANIQNALPGPQWPALTVRYLATRSNDYLADVRENVKTDAVLSAGQRDLIVQAVDALADKDRTFFSEERLKQKVDFPVTLAEQELAYTLMLLVGALRRDDQGAASEQEKMRFLGNCLQIGRILKDSYLTAIVAEQYANVVISPTTSEEGRDILSDGIDSLEWLSADVERLAALREDLEKWSRHMQSSIGLSVQEMAGVDAATFAAADADDRQAQKLMLRNLWLQRASALIWTSDLPWTHYLQRVIGSGSEQTMSDFFGVIERDRKNRTISDKRARVLDNLLQQFVGPDEVGVATEEAVLAEFPENDPDHPFIDLFLLHDKLASGERQIGIDELKAAISLSKQIKAPGAESYFTSVWVQRSLASENLEEVLEKSKENLHILEALEETDPEYSRRLVMNAIQTMQIAQYAGEVETVTLIVNQYSEQIRSLAAEQEELM